MLLSGIPHCMSKGHHTLALCSWLSPISSQHHNPSSPWLSGARALLPPASCLLQQPVPQILQNQLPRIPWCIIYYILTIGVSYSSIYAYFVCFHLLATVNSPTVVMQDAPQSCPIPLEVWQVPFLAGQLAQLLVFGQGD